MKPPPVAGVLLAAALTGAVGVAEELPPDLGTRRGGIDWPRFLGPAVDSRSPEAPIRTEWGAAGPPLVWAKEVGEGYAMPSISRGRLFHFDRHGDRARLSCLHSETGEELWRSEYPTAYADYYGYSPGPRTSPLVDGARVYTYGVEGRLRCHRAVDGALLWEVDTTSRFGVVQNFFGVGSSPIVEGELLIVQVGGSPPGSPRIHSGRVRGNGTGIVAFDKRSGEVRWTAGDELASYASPVTATIAGRRWGFLLTRGGLLGFEPLTGAIDFLYPWRAKILESVNASTPVVVGDTVFVSETYGPGSSLVRVRPGGYEVVWKDPPRGKSLATHWNTPVYHEGHLYASSGRGSGDAELRCVEHATGRVRWSRPGLRHAALLYADRHLVVLSEIGVLRLVEANPESYREVAVADLARATAAIGGAVRPLLRAPAWNAPVLSHGLLYLLGKDTLLALELRPAAAAQRSAAQPAAGSGG